MSAQKKSPDDLLTTAEIARNYGVDRKTVTRWCADKVLPAKLLGRDYVVRRADLADFSRPVRGRPEKKQDS